MRLFLGALLSIIFLTGCVASGTYQSQRSERSPESAFAYGNKLYAQGHQNEGIDWIKRAADSNHVPAQYALALLMASGQLGEKSRSDAIHYLSMASESGSHQASFKLGEYYRTGILGEADIDKAVEYYELAIYQGSMDARKTLGVMYLRGIEVEKDSKKAQELLAVFQ